MCRSGSKKGLKQCVGMSLGPYELEEVIGHMVIERPAVG